MQPPKHPSLFKASNPKSFSFKPRYYDERKERRKELEKGKKAHIKFSRNYNKTIEKGRSIRIIFLIIILSLFAYKFIIN